MTILPASFKAFQFQSGLEIVRNAFRASIATMAEASDKAHQAHIAYVMSGEDDREYEDGILVSSAEHELEYAQMEASIALRVVRESFITSVFHYWERSARGWTNLKSSGKRFSDLEEAVRAMYSVHPRLTHLNTLNNLLKHDNEDLAKKLVVDWPSLFCPLFHQSMTVVNPVHRLSISDTHVEEAFEIVASSGPQYE